MNTAPSRAESCVECGESLTLFQPVCEECETVHDWAYRAPCHDCGETVSYRDGNCPNCRASLSIWRALEADALGRAAPITVWKAAVPRPTAAGYRVHLGSIHGQWADYRRSLGDSGDFHVRSFPKRYELHHDEVSAIGAPGRHLLRHGLPAATASGIGLTARITGHLADSLRVASEGARSSVWPISGGE
jgi:hypothetical protein